MPKLPAATEPKKHRVFADLGEAAKYCGMVPRTVRDWRADGLIQPTKNGRWSTKSLWAVYVRKEQEEEDRRAAAMEEGVTSGNSPALERYRSAKADVMEMERDKLRGELIEKAEADEIMLAKVNFLSQSLDAFATIVAENLSTRGVIAAPDIGTAERVIQEEVETYKKYLSGEEE